METPSQPHPTTQPDTLAAAPNHHALLFENESIRILNITIPPGATVPPTPIAGPAPSTTGLR